MLTGPVGAEVAPSLEAAFAMAAEEERNVLLSFEACDHLDREVLAPIRSGRRRLEQDGVEVHVFGVSAQVRALLAEAPGPEPRPRGRQRGVTPWLARVGHRLHVS